ncbi:MAG: GTPase Era [Sandaracinaceae bacterium]
MSGSVLRAGRVAIVGRPNVGKSTLLNAVLQQPLAIVAPRPGTTRSRLLAVCEVEDPPAQIAFVDTPGLERPRSVLGRALHEEAQAALEEVDVVLVVVDASGLTAHGDPIAAADEDVVMQAAETGRKVILALNKVDRLRDKSVLLPALEAWDKKHALAALVPMSASKSDNVDALIRAIAAQLPEGRLYDEDFLTDRPLRYFAAEYVREAVLAHTRQEVPHGVAVRIDRFADEDALARIDASILVNKPSHKGIVIGAGGALLKQIGTEARSRIEHLLERKVFLNLFVKVEEGWTKNPDKVRRLTRESE